MLPTELCRARVHRALGDARARSTCCRAERARSAAPRTTWLRAEALSELAELLHEAGRADEAADVAARGRAARRRRRAASSGRWRRCGCRRSLTGDADAGRAYLELAERERLAVRGRAGAARARRARRRPARSTSLAAHRRVRRPRRRAVAAARGVGAARRRADARRGRPRASARRSPTPRSGSCGSCCDGLTNRQIAAALHYSPKTVEVYLSRIYAKTKCASRVELVRAHGTGSANG